MKLFHFHFIAKRLYSGSGIIKAQKYVLTKYFQGEPKKTDFQLVEEVLPDLRDGEILTEAEYISVDPFMRAYMIGYKLPVDMIGGQVAKIVASRNEHYPIGKYVTGSFGWRTHTICNPEKLKGNAGFAPFSLLPDISPYPVSLALGILGMPGRLGSNSSLRRKLMIRTTLLKRDCPPACFVPARDIAAYPLRVASPRCCRVVGFAGTDEKCYYLEKELGFDRAFNYKTVDIKAALKEGAPRKVDCYFDNVGGQISSNIINYMNKYGRVAVCGSISSYNESCSPKATILQPAIVLKELKIEGFLVDRWIDRWEEGINANLRWLVDGKLKYEEKVYHGFDNMVDAFVGMLRGENTGKAVVKIK
ncbi:prostaglandin reductase 1-like [Bombyx mandarina]|uniref:15-oxoprostaglandin 13-reductase n=1 Tax=Bombyx mandarina TaxID=7092 RepID=A0A6J2KG34_BOMMA|nr:prostaglandin reductase 1-like [Bombyx mandarina]